MSKIQKSKTFWLGLITFGYSFFLLCQGTWLMTYYPYIYPVTGFVMPGATPNYNMLFTNILVLATPIVGGLILMGVGVWNMVKIENKKVLLSGLIILICSFVLAFQAIWTLFIFPKFTSDLYHYATTNIFTNYPRFFLILGAVIPPLAGSIIFIAIGLITIKLGLEREQPLT